MIIAFCTPAWAADTIKIGVIGPMNFVQGKGHWNGAMMAADEINAQGGVKVGNRKMKIQLIKADSNEFLNVADATNAMEMLVLREKVDAVVGGFRSEAVLAMQDIAMDAKTLFFGVGAAHPELCTRVAKDYKRYKYFFRGAPFNSNYLVKTTFIQLRTVAGLLKKELGIDRIKVAVIAEKAMWVDPMIKAAEGFIPQMGMELVGTWRPSPVATDVTAELSAVQRTGAHMIFTIFSSSVGIPFARQAGELKIPAAIVGINVEAQKESFWQATQGMANYIMTLSTYCPGAEYNELTKPFMDRYQQLYGEPPAYTADTYSVIKNTLVPAIESTGTLDANKLIPFIEEHVHLIPAGKLAYLKDEQGRQLHEHKWGPGFLTSLALQWQDGKQVPVWPHFKWMSPQWEFSAEPPEKPNEASYKGIQPYKISPWMIAAYKK